MKIRARRPVASPKDQAVQPARIAMEPKKAVGEDPTIEEGAQLTLDEARNASLLGARVAEPGLQLVLDYPIEDCRLGTARDGFGVDLITRLGDAFSYGDLDIEERDYEGVPVKVVTTRTLWRMKRDTSRPTDRFDAEVLADRFGFRED